MASQIKKSEAKALENLKTEKVSLVQFGAQGKRFAITKGEQSMLLNDDAADIVKSCVDVPLPNEKEILEQLKKHNLPEKALNATIGAIRIMGGYADLIPDDVMKTICSMDVKKSKEVKIEKMPDDVQEVFKSYKAQLDDYRDRVEKSEKRAEEMALVLKGERDQRLMKEHVAKAGQMYSHLSKTSEELGSMFKDLYDLDKDLADKFSEVCKTANDVIKGGDAFGPIGSSHTDHSNSAWDLIESKADKIVKDSGQKVSKSAAIAQVMTDEPQLYEQYLNESGEV